jgi:hypothetical protein
MRIRGRLLAGTVAAIASLAFAALPVKAQTVEDPLHGCQSTGCSEATIGGTKVTPITSPINFGFFASPTQSGDLLLKFLLPDTLTLTQAEAFASSHSVTGTSSSSLTLFLNNGASSTPWTSGNLESDYLGFTSFANGSPPNPLSAWLPATQTLVPGADGYWVATADMGFYSLPTPGGVLPDVFSLSPANFPAGGLIVGDLFTGCTPNTTVPCRLGDVTTAQSGALFVPVPAAGAGVPGLVAACAGLLALARRRRQKVA